MITHNMFNDRCKHLKQALSTEYDPRDGFFFEWYREELENLLTTYE